MSQDLELLEAFCRWPYRSPLASCEELVHGHDLEEIDICAFFIITPFERLTAQDLFAYRNALSFFTYCGYLTYLPYYMSAVVSSSIAGKDNVEWELAETVLFSLKRRIQDIAYHEPYLIAVISDALASWLRCAGSDQRLRECLESEIKEIGL